MSADLINQPEIYESSVLPETKKDRLRVTTGEMILGVNYDLLEVTYPNDVTTVLTYSKDAVTVRTITIIYTDLCKTDLVSAAVS